MSSAKYRLPGYPGNRWILSVLKYPGNQFEYPGIQVNAVLLTDPRPYSYSRYFEISKLFVVFMIFNLIFNLNFNS